MSNYDALLTLIGDINNAFCHLEDEDVADICDGDMRLLDKAVKRFKTTVWENQLTQWHNKVPRLTPRDYNKYIKHFFPL